MSRRRLWWMMSPLALWLVVVAVCWILQYYWIASAEERVKVRGNIIRLAGHRGEETAAAAGSCTARRRTRC